MAPVRVAPRRLRRLLAPLAPLALVVASCDSPSEPGEPLRNVTPEGAVVTTAVAPATIMRGDTARITVTIANPRDTAITLHFPDSCSVMIDVENGRGESVFGDGLVICPGGPEEIRIPARDAWTRSYPFTGILPVGNDFHQCVPVGSYSALAYVWRSTAGGGSTRSNAARLTVRDVRENPMCVGLEPGTLPACGLDGMSLSAAGGVNPTFTWTPACRIGSLRVVDLTSGQDVWWIESFWAGIAPGARFGVAPARSRVRAAPVPLVAGNTYLVETTAVGNSYVLRNARLIYRP